MKLLILIIFSCSLFAKSTMTIKEHKLFHSYNNRPIVKIRKAKEIKKIKKISKEDARKIVKKLTGNDIIYIKLFHRGKYLKYFIKTSSNEIIILNAINGKVLYRK